MEFTMTFLIAVVLSIVWNTPLWVISFFGREKFMQSWNLKSLGLFCYLLSIPFYCFFVLFPIVF